MEDIECGDCGWFHGVCVSCPNTVEEDNDQDLDLELSESTDEKPRETS